MPSALRNTIPGPLRGLRRRLGRVLLAWGENDRFFRLELAKRLEQLFPDARLVRFHEGLTFLSLDEPDRLATEIAAFVSSTAGAAYVS